MRNQHHKNKMINYSIIKSKKSNFHQKLNSQSSFFVNAPQPQSNKQKQNHSQSHSGQATQQDNTQNKFRLCNNNSFHLLTQCPMFISKLPSERHAYVMHQKPCVNCLRFNHRVQDCASTYNCKISRFRHHTMICR